MKLPGLLVTDCRLAEKPFRYVGIQTSDSLRLLVTGASDAASSVPDSAVPPSSDVGPESLPIDPLLPLEPPEDDPLEPLDDPLGEPLDDPLDEPPEDPEEEPPFHACVLPSLHPQQSATPNASTDANREDSAETRCLMASRERSCRGSATRVEAARAERVTALRVFSRTKTRFDPPRSTEALRGRSYESCVFFFRFIPPHRHTQCALYCGGGGGRGGI